MPGMLQLLNNQLYINVVFCKNSKDFLHQSIKTCFCNSGKRKPEMVYMAEMIRKWHGQLCPYFSLKAFGAFIEYEYYFD